MLRKLIAGSIALLCSVAAADQYTGPKPAKADIPYLLHAEMLVATETAEATESHPKKDETVFSIPGASSPVKTPLAEPIFLLQSKQLSPETLELYKFEVSGGKRQVVTGKRHHNDETYHLSVKNLGEGLYRIEVSDVLEDGEYSLSPTGSNQAFCFAVVD